MIGHVAGDAAYVTLIPLGGIAFRAIGRSPILGAIIAFVSISTGYDGSPSLNTTDILLSTISTTAAQTIDPAAFITPTANYFFGLASPVLISLVITVVVEKFLAERPDLEVDEHHVDNKDEDSSYLEVHPEAGRALKFVGLVSILFFAALIAALAFPASPFRGEGDGILSSPIMTGMAGVIGTYFALVGITYGRIVGTYSRIGDPLEAMTQGFRSMAREF